METKTLIVGYGITGKNLHKELKKVNIDLFDKKYDGYLFNPTYNTYDLIFVCVDTPYKGKDNPCDLSAIHSVIEQWKPKLESDGVFVIKSTLLPGNTRKLAHKYNVKIVHSPEYYGDTQHCNNFTYNFTILGGEKKDCIKVQQFLQMCHDATHTFRIVDYETAELAKYMENCYLAMKVSFCNQFYEIAETVGVNYETLRELFILDPRINPSHTFVYRDMPYWDSHCLNKDVRAIADNQKAELLLEIIKFNEKQKCTHDSTTTQIS